MHRYGTLYLGWPGSLFGGPLHAIPGGIRQKYKSITQICSTQQHMYKQAWTYTDIPNSVKMVAHSNNCWSYPNDTFVTHNIYHESGTKLKFKMYKQCWSASKAPDDATGYRHGHLVTLVMLSVYSVLEQMHYVSYRQLWLDTHNIRELVQLITVQWSSVYTTDQWGTTFSCILLWWCRNTPAISSKLRKHHWWTQLP